MKNFYLPFLTFPIYCVYRKLKLRIAYVNVTLPGFDPIVHTDSLTNAGVGVLVSTKFQTTIMGKNELNSDCEDI